MEFQMNWYLRIPYFDDMEYYEFEWKYDRMIEKIKQINSSNNSSNIADGTRFT